MWRHGIHAFLEVLRHRLPESQEHILAFIYIAYSMMTLLYETVPTFEDTWIECLGKVTVIRGTSEAPVDCIYLGDLGRYRMAIEDDEPREVWNNAACFWYSKAVDKSPDVGRLYHHLAILARPYTLEQLSLYTRALTCLTPFESARGSVLTLFDPILQGKNLASRRSSSFEIVFLRAHGILFTSHPSDSIDCFDEAVEELDVGGLCGSYISQASSRFKETGVHAAVSNIAALLEYGTPKQKSPKSRLRLAYENAHSMKKQLSTPAHNNLGAPGIMSPSTESSQPEAMTSESEMLPLFISRPSRLASITLGISLKHADHKNVHPLVHVYLVFIWSLILVQQAWNKFEDDPIWGAIEKDIPWAAVCAFLNTLAAEPFAMTAKVWAEDFPKPEKDTGRPLPEDFILRGQLYSRWYFPHTWFTDAMIDADERTLDMPSIDQLRIERILWLGLRIASVSLIAMLLGIANTLQAARWIHYDVGAKSFVATDHVNVNLTADAKLQPQPIYHESVVPDVDSSKCDDDIAQYTPSEDSTMSNIKAPYFTPGTASNAPLESHDKRFEPKGD
ncbi:hypothetical protein MMC28_007219 [Mycoblastus sanguinarius]|nr:hypothetical protein [Mycoblastus sanguinarius]